jgi:hypothetical protein
VRQWAAVFGLTVRLERGVSSQSYCRWGKVRRKKMMKQLPLLEQTHHPVVTDMNSNVVIFHYGMRKLNPIQAMSTLKKLPARSRKRYIHPFGSRREPSMILTTILLN